MKNYLGYLISPASTKLNDLTRDPNLVTSRRRQRGSAPLQSVRRPTSPAHELVARHREDLLREHEALQLDSRHLELDRKIAEIHSSQQAYLSRMAMQLVKSGQTLITIKSIQFETILTKMRFGRGAIVRTSMQIGDQHFPCSSQILSRDLFRTDKFTALSSLLERHYAEIIAEQSSD